MPLYEKRFNVIRPRHTGWEERVLARVTAGLLQPVSKGVQIEAL